MESLEKVIKQKCKFIGYNLQSYSDLPPDIILFLTYTTIESENIITLHEEMTPLLVRLFSCICCNDERFGEFSVHIQLKFPYTIYLILKIILK